jgi:hypothetical protein
MFLHEKEINLPLVGKNSDLLDYFSAVILKKLPSDEMPIRFVVTRTDDKGYHCELGVLSDTDNYHIPPRNSIFEFRKRDFENTEQFNAVLLVPTGIGAEIGGHSGDAGPIARLLAASCNNLITHPNVVNASDINELPENGLYVEGSVITRLLMGTVGLQKVRSNRVLLIIDKHHDSYFSEAAINSVSAARAALGLDCPTVLMMNKKMNMHSLYSSSGRAIGKIDYFERLCDVLMDNRPRYDAVALSSIINVPIDFHKSYFHADIINPWGGVEAMLTHAVSTLFSVPSAHSPMMETREILNLDVGVVDPRKSAEALSTTFLHCILKGLHKSPKIINNPLAYSHNNILSVSDISCLIIPDGCVGLPTLAALEQEIPVIAVKENKNRMQNKLADLPFKSGKLFIVDNYLEAVGVMNVIKSGVSLESVRRPLSYTDVSESHKAQEIHLLKSKVEQLNVTPKFENQRKREVS